jgi:RNA polymerase-binding transcription factor DksA
MLSSTDLQAVHEWLDVRSGELEAEIALKLSPSEDAAAAAGDRKDEADRSTAALTRDAEVERDLAELRAVVRARERLAEGTYGRCEHCGEPIDPRRLRAQPIALRCYACQANAEARARGAAGA